MKGGRRWGVGRGRRSEGAQSSCLIYSRVLRKKEGKIVFVSTI